MQNADAWQPTKFESTNAGWRGSRNKSELAVSSRIIGDRLADCYERVLREHARGHLIDLGCGKAPLYGIYRDLVTQVTCVDWAAGLHGTTFLDYEADLNSALPIPSESADTIVSTDVLEHIRDPDLFWSELGRLLRPGGKLILGTPFYYWLHEAPHDYQRFTEFKLRDFCEREGFELVSMERVGGAPEVLADICGKLLRNRDLACRAFVGAAGAMLKLGPVRSFSKRTEQLFPLAYCLVAMRP